MLSTLGMTRLQSYNWSCNSSYTINANSNNYLPLAWIFCRLEILITDTLLKHRATYSYVMKTLHVKRSKRAFNSQHQGNLSMEFYHPLFCLFIPAFFRLPTLSAFSTRDVLHACTTTSHTRCPILPQPCFGERMLFGPSSIICSKLNLCFNQSLYRSNIIIISIHQPWSS